MLFANIYINLQYYLSCFLLENKYSELNQKSLIKIGLIKMDNYIPKPIYQGVLSRLNHFDDVIYITY